jgi:hypothetical protein
MLVTGHGQWTVTVSIQLVLKDGHLCDSGEMEVGWVRIRSKRGIREGQQWWANSFGERSGAVLDRLEPFQDKKFMLNGYGTGRGQLCKRRNEEVREARGVDGHWIGLGIECDDELVVMSWASWNRT